ncbi:hypothetical protein KY290_036744 [Solanum tuberosum]|uniref:Uncharacterized protein n=1 Tax=Solanum tuberosum TaxID=4113 RepID=A0ABQ7TTK9_SOLTU|nr:hypothetical protein KY290_036744 [Solanum tuberosum]
MGIPFQLEYSDLPKPNIQEGLFIDVFNVHAPHDKIYHQVVGDSILVDAYSIQCGVMLGMKIHYEEQVGGANEQNSDQDWGVNEQGANEKNVDQDEAVNEQGVGANDHDRGANQQNGGANDQYLCANELNVVQDEDANEQNDDEDRVAPMK